MEKKTLYFLCTGNSCRSQMAEGWAKCIWARIGMFTAPASKLMV